MARPSNEFLLAWSSLTGSDTEPGWQAISLPSAGALQVRAGRRSPDNAEAVLVGFPTARLAAADKLPEGQGFAVERQADLREILDAVDRRAVEELQCAGDDLRGDDVADGLRGGVHRAERGDHRLLRGGLGDELE